MRKLLSIAFCAAVSWATMVACGAPLESLRLDFESGLSGAFKHADGLIIAGEGGSGFFRYLMEESLPNGAKIVRISGLDVLSDLPEGAALLDSVVDYLAKQKENR